MRARVDRRIAAVGLALALARAASARPNADPRPDAGAVAGAQPDGRPVLPSGDGEGGAVIGASNPQAGLAAKAARSDLPTNTPATWPCSP